MKVTHPKITNCIGKILLYFISGIIGISTLTIYLLLYSIPVALTIIILDYLFF